MRRQPLITNNYSIFMHTISLSLSERQIKARLRSCILKGKRMVCHHCGSHQLIYLKKEDRYHCKKCRKKTSLFRETWLRHVKISLKLFLKILIAWTKEFSVHVAAEACETSHVTVRRYYRLFRQHIVKSLEFKPQHDVQVDEAYFGQFKKQANYFHGVRRYKVIDKVCVAGIGCPTTGELYARVIRAIPKGSAIREMIREQVPTDITVYADGSYIYTRLRSTHELIQQTHDLGFHHAYFIEGCWSWMKRKLFKMYHHFDRKYAEEYIAELTWRFNTRKSPKDPWIWLRNSF